MATIKLQITAKGSDGSKSFTIPNPVAKESFKQADANAFVTKWAQTYLSDVTLVSADYVTTAKDRVYPEA